MTWKFELLRKPTAVPLTEGPVWDGEQLLFTHIRASLILRYDPKSGAITEWRTGTNRTNGLAFDLNGRLFGCCSGGRSIVRFDPDGKNVVIADRLDGRKLSTPNDLAIAWPLDNATPWAGPLILGGALVFGLGIALLVSGFVHHRRSRGPRRNRGKLPSAPKPSRRNQVTSGGRRSISRAKRVAIVPFLAIPALALSACSADYWPTFDAAPASTGRSSPTRRTPAHPSRSQGRAAAVRR